MEKSGEQFLHQRDQKLHTSTPVEHEQERRQRAGEEVSQKPADKLAAWMKVLEKTHMGHMDDPRVLERIKSYYHHENVTVTLEDIPQSYWNNRAEFMIRQGYGGDMIQGGVVKQTRVDKNGEELTDYIFPEDLREKELAVIQSNQESSLDRWLDYLTSEDAPYPMWAKYWAFTSILKMGKFEKQTQEDETEKANFQKRTKTTTNSFPLLNSQALTKTISSMLALLKEKERVRGEKQKPKEQRDEDLLRLQVTNESKKLSDEEFRSLLSTENFSKLYAQFLVEIPEYTTEGLKNIKGEWKVFPQGSAKELIKSLEGYPLEWCIADFDTAQGYLQGGDIHIYYTYN